MQEDEKKLRSFFKASTETASQAKSWSLPVVDSGESPKGEGYTNVMKKPEGWVYEPPEPEAEEPKPPTLEEIEAIRKDAHDEGFAEGKEAGFAQGLEEGKTQGHEEGLQTGHDEGYAAGLEQGTSVIEEKAEVWNQLLDNLQQPIRHVDQQVEQQIVELATELARAIVKTEIQTNQQVLLQTVKEAVNALPAKTTHYEIHLHPEDIQLIVEAYGEDGIEQRNWRLLAEPALSRGSCEIKADTSSVTYTIEQRISEILDRFLQDSSSSN